jgi:hypothetical protein
VCPWRPFQGPISLQRERRQGGLKEEKGINRIFKRELLQPRRERAQPRNRGGTSSSYTGEGVGEWLGHESACSPSTLRAASPP